MSVKNPNRKGSWPGKLIKDVKKGLWGILVALICALVISAALWPFGFRADVQASLFKILGHILVFQKVERPPQIHLFSQYPYEYNIRHPDGWISEGDALEISQDNKPLWLGIYNSEPRVLHNVRFILSPHNDVKVFNEATWRGAWLIYQFGQDRATRYQYRFFVNIPPRTGMVLPIPIELEFQTPGDYNFSYVVISDEYGPRKGSFVIRRLK